MKTYDTRAQEDAIFRQFEWLNVGSTILRDGAVDEKAYWAPNNFRILFVLKEGNDPTGEWSAKNDLRDFAAGGARYKTWVNLACWSAHARSVTFELSDRKNAEWRAKQLRHSAFINLKKIPGGAIANNQAVIDFALRYADLLREQICLYKPHLTIACGLNTFISLEKIFNGKREKCGELFWYMQHETLGTVLDFYHPQARVRGGAQTFLDYLQSNLKYHFRQTFDSIGEITHGRVAQV